MKKITTALLFAACAFVVSCGPTAKTPQKTGTRPADVVQIGYGATTKDKLTTPVSSVKVDENQVGSYNNIIDYIRGRVPGVTIGPDDGTGKPKITIRGNSSINSGGDPLILVDNVETPLMTVNPNDVYSVDVIKDSAASIYGMRGVNGVILIKTKSAREAAIREQERKNAEKAARKEAKKKERKK